MAMAAALSAFLPTFSFCTTKCNQSSSTFNLPLPSLPFQSHPNYLSNLSISRSNKFPKFLTKIRSVAEEQETLGVDAVTGEEILAPPEQPVSVPVSPSDVLTMSFQAEGTMNEKSIDKVIRALDEQEGISDLRVQVLEGIASVQLKKQTTVQATGVSSGLVEIIQGSGFKLQTLSLSFDDEDEEGPEGPPKSTEST